MPPIVYFPVTVAIIVVIGALIFVGVGGLIDFGQRALALSPRDSIQRVTTPRYEAVTDFLSPAERSFFGVLQQTVSSDFIILAKVRLADIVHPAKNPSRSAWQSAFNRISCKHIDFVLCDPARLSVLLAIELDDRSHGSLERGFRDNLVDSALEDSRIPMLRVPARQSYAPTQLRRDIDRLLGRAAMPVSGRQSPALSRDLVHDDSRYMPKN